MRRKTLHYLSIAFVFFVGIGTLQSLPSGAPTDGRTGSPGDGGKTCATAGCHSSTPATVSNIITHNIPAEGYTPGATYTITVTVDGTGKKGLCISPQKPDGTVVGTLTAGVGNAVTGKGYITHTTPMTANPAVWSFTWTAPAAGTGSFSFYGAFANNRTLVRKTVEMIPENTATSLTEAAGLTDFEMYPNPLTGEAMHVGFEIRKSEHIKMAILDITGKEVAVLREGGFMQGRFQETFELPQLNRGIYFLQIVHGNETTHKKFLKQ